MMKFLGYVFLVVLVCFGILAIKGTALDKESKQYADAAILALVTNWDMNELEGRISPEFKSTVQPGDVQKLFAMLRRLGSLKEYKGYHGSSNMSFTSERGKVISATYVENAEFAAGSAEIHLALIKHGDQWQILGFHVNSKAFL